MKRYPASRRRGRALWLGLFVALTAAGLLISRRRPEARSTAAIPARVQVVPDTPPPLPVRSAIRVHRVRQAVEGIPTITPITVRDATECGYEMPFSGSEVAPIDVRRMGTDSASLRAALEGGTAWNVSAFLNTGTAATEIEAIRLLIQLGGKEALAAALGRMLTLPPDSPDYGKYLAAFSDCRSAAVAGWLSRFLGRTDQEEVRQRVLAILGALRGPDVVESLAAQLAAPADVLHAEDCARSLMRVSDPGQVGALKALLITGESSDLRALAAYGLASVGNAESCAALVEWGSSSEAVAAAYRDALATVASSYGQEALIRAAVNPAVPSAVRCSVVYALSSQQGQRVRTVLTNLGQGSHDPALQTAICQAVQSVDKSGTPPQSGGTAVHAGAGGEVCFQ